MSFDWDSIKVTNNPDLKEIETSFNPLSELAGTDSDPTIGVGPPSTGGDGGDGGGDGDGPGEGLIDCQPPADYVPCPTQDCFAADTFLVDLDDSEALSLLSYDGTASMSGEFPSFSAVDTSSDALVLVPELVNKLVSSAGTSTGPCAPIDLYSAAPRTQTGSNLQYIPNDVKARLGTDVLKGEKVEFSGAASFYLYGRDSSGTPVSYPSGTYVLMTVSMGAWKDTVLNVSVEDATITAQVYNENGKAYLKINNGTEQIVEINSNSIDVTGLYRVGWASSLELLGDGTPVTETSLTVNALGSGASAQLTGGAIGGWKADTKVRLGRRQDKNYARYFSYGGSAAQVPSVLYVGDGSSIDIDAFEEAINQSQQEYVTPVDCVESWTRPTGCADCAKPADCFPDCNAYIDNLVTGATMGTQAEMDAIYGTDAIEFGQGIRFINKNGYNPSQGTDPAALPSYNTGEWATLISGGDYDVPCADNIVALRPGSGFDNQRLSIFSGAEMAAVQYQGPYTDAATSPPRALLNETVTGTYRALIHVPADTGSVQLLYLSVPFKRVDGAIGNKFDTWTMAWDRTAKTVTLSQGVQVASVVIPYDGGPLIDIQIDASLIAKIEDIGGGLFQNSDRSTATGFVNGTAFSLDVTLTPAAVIYEEYLGHFSNANHGTILDNTVRVLAITKTNDAAFEAVATGIKRTFPTYVSTETKCTEIPEGCPDVILPAPGGDCPCSCRGFTIDPLGCNPSIITGGLYSTTESRPLTDGVFPNYDGSFGRVNEYLSGELSNLANDINSRVKILYGSDVLYAIRRKGAADRHWSSGLKDYEGQQFGVGFTDTHEFCALLGHTDNQVFNEPVLVTVPDMNGQSFGRNGSLAYKAGLYVLRGDNSTVINNGININVQVARSAPGSIQYQKNNTIGGYDTVEVDLPPEVLDPNDKLYWVSAKTTFGIQELGAGVDVIPGYTNGVYMIYRSFARSDIYINGYLIAEDVYTNYKSGYVASDPGYYAEVNTGVAPPVAFPDMKFGTSQTAGGNPSADSIPSIFINEPNLGTNSHFIAFMDEGPGASLIPASEQGRNLARIDPNNTPYKDCNCP